MKDAQRNYGTSKSPDFVRAKLKVIQARLKPNNSKQRLNNNVRGFSFYCRLLWLFKEARKNSGLPGFGP